MTEWTPSADELALHGDARRHMQYQRRLKDAVKRCRASGTVVVPAEQYQVVAVLGQSNAHGAGRISGSYNLPAPNPNVHQVAGCGRYRGRIVLAQEPLLHDTPGGGVGFATTFGRKLYSSNETPVLLVPAARGDTSFYPKNGYSWNPANHAVRVNLFDNAVQQIAHALRLTGPRSKLAAILWHQGESDVPLTGPAQYASALDSVISGLRGRFGFNVPVILGQMVPEEIATGHHRYPGIDAVHRDTPNRNPRCCFVEGPTGSHNDGETIHYNAIGAQALGEAMFAAFLTLDPPRAL